MQNILKGAASGSRIASKNYTCQLLPVDATIRREHGRTESGDNRRNCRAAWRFQLVNDIVGV